FAISVKDFKEKCKTEGNKQYDKIISLSDNDKLTHEQVSCTGFLHDSVIPNKRNTKPRQPEQIFSFAA
ncbi:TPA: hypothetical protein N6P17_004720, partial [Escherichia coli]|nr:hypothetical protein [Escherichia coli]